MKLTVKEAILKSLEEFNQGGTAKEVSKHILDNHYCDFQGKTPEKTIGALLGDFITNGDTRVKRIKNKDNVFIYYLPKNENNVNNCPVEEKNANFNEKKKKSYIERDLHPLLCTLLKEQEIYAKTIFHEESNKNEEYQKWIHPDIIGAKFIQYKNDTCQSFFKAINRTNAVEIYSYELKKEITSDYELKKCFFQTVSNSSWANYGYLVAFEIGNNLLGELERLNHSFGIGVIHLKANPYESQILFPARNRPLDFKTIEKLCNINKKFSDFFKQIEKVITAEPKFVEDVRKGMETLCDKPLKNDSDIMNHCNEKHIPVINK